VIPRPNGRGILLSFALLFRRFCLHEVPATALRFYFFVRSLSLPPRVGLSILINQDFCNFPGVSLSLVVHHLSSSSGTFSWPCAGTPTPSGVLTFSGDVVFVPGQVRALSGRVFPRAAFCLNEGLFRIWFHSPIFTGARIFLCPLCFCLICIDQFYLPAKIVLLSLFDPPLRFPPPISLPRVISLSLGPDNIPFSPIPFLNPVHVPAWTFQEFFFF